MRKIALIMEGWKRYITYAWPSGILQKMKETDEDINLYIFNSSGGWSLDEKYNTGEYNIHHLPDFKEFDGIILDLNNIGRKDVCEFVIDKAKKSGKPVISIANEIEDFYYVGIDNYRAIQNVIEHLYEKHACQSYWFIMGGKENYENQKRVLALKEFLEKHQITYRDDDFYYGSYEYGCGYEGFREMRQRHTKLPDAVICANDNIAVGVCQAASEEGLSVPDDFCVTGFDNFDKAVYFTPSITTVSHIREEVGYACADILIRIWNGEDVPKLTYTETTFIPAESCGCGGEMINRREHAKNQIMYGIETDNFEEQVIALEYALMRCNNVREMTKWIPKCIPAFQCDAMYLVVDDRINDYKRNPDYVDSNLPGDDGFMVCGYPEHMVVELAYEDGKISEGKAQKIEGIFPMFDYPERGSDFLFLPLHFRERTVGYFVIRNAVYLMEKQYLFQVLRVLTSAMENLHKKEKLEYLNKELSELYVRDAMTGLYNRMGYQRLGYKLFEEKKQDKEDFAILFMDMDRLKYINDHFGHECGDAAIKVIARAILKNVSKEDIPVRNGGDEFVVFLRKAQKKEVDEIAARIVADIGIQTRNEQLPFDVSVSVGSIYTDISTEKTLDDYIREADEVMYKNKVNKNAQRV